MDNRSKLKENTGDFSIITDDLITDELSKHLTVKDLRHLQKTCLFFVTHPGVKQKIQEKLKLATRIIANQKHTFILQKDGTAYVIGKDINTTHPQRITLPNQRPIADIIVYPNYSYTIYLDDSGNAFTYKNQVEEPIAIKFPCSPQPKIIKVAMSSSDTLFITDKGECYYLLNLYLSHSILGNLNKKIHLIKSSNTHPVKNAKVGRNLYFLQDQQNQWHLNDNAPDKFDHLFKQKDGSLYNSTLICFSSGKAIIDIVVNDQTICLLDDTGQWFIGMGKLFNGTTSHLTPIMLPKESEGNCIVKIIPLNGLNETYYCQDNMGAWFYFENTTAINLQTQTLLAYLVPLEFPYKNKKIVHVVPASTSHILFGDEKGNWYGMGNNEYGQLGTGEVGEKVETITLIDFSNMITNQQPSNLPKPK
jgi:alpha-tubulin suppressor-like RCC1 family protein